MTFKKYQEIGTCFLKNKFTKKYSVGELKKNLHKIHIFLSLLVKQLENTMLTDITKIECY